MTDMSEMTWRKYRENLRAQARDAGIPIFGSFELTPLCNFNCKMCYVHLSERRMNELGRLRTADEWIDMARQARDAGTIAITLTGGEIFTRPDFEKIYLAIRDLGIMVSLISNGSLIDDRIARLLRDYPPASLRVTLYGASDSTYTRLCGVENGFSRVMKGLNNLVDYSVPFTLSFTRTTLNDADFESVKGIAKEYGVGFISSYEIVPAVRGASNSPDDLRIELPSTADKARYRVPDSRALLPGNPAFDTCKSYRCSFWIDWNGDMDMCAFMSSSKCKPFEVGFKSAWGDLIDKITNIHLPDECRQCEWRDFCYACPGIREAECGSPEHISERICNRACYAYKNYLLSHDEGGA